MRSAPYRAGVPCGLLPLLFSGCLGSLEDPDRFLGGSSRDAGVSVPDLGTPASCPDVLTNILAGTQAPRGCAQTNCHSSAANAMGLDLETANIIDRLSDTPSSTQCGSVPLIDSDNIPNSLLLTKLGPGPYRCGEQMPTGAVLTDFEVSCVTRYIEEGLGEVDAGVPAPDVGVPDLGPIDGIAVEAEAMTLTSPFRTQTAANASSGMFITQPLGVINPDPTATNGIGRAVFDFTVPNAGPARVFGRVRATIPDGDSFWVRVDDGPYLQWNDLFFLSSGNWVWDAVHDTRIDNGTDAVEVFSLTAGAHRLEIVFREANAQLDQIIITQDASFTPPGS
ncbi:MAG: hypothetical protein AAFZ18_34150 [Myxococcota bacterium]